ncbi:hypothetical protein KIN20_013378 [Parelaphostrongylus tenuis]|uniref:Uncharacterized protein n=1 Tax=Parelaphostrongylus tenuis TaxID=148309 RepID=A0AAD5QQY8_PARTN|nr:hypothetical protein KIN20_013378 [Parelaphostrongylus tenuis]
MIITLDPWLSFVLVVDLSRSLRLDCTRGVSPKKTGVKESEGEPPHRGRTTYKQAVADMSLSEAIRSCAIKWNTGGDGISSFEPFIHYIYGTIQHKKPKRYRGVTNLAPSVSERMATTNLFEANETTKMFGTLECSGKI